MKGGVEGETRKKKQRGLLSTVRVVLHIADESLKRSESILLHVRSVRLGRKDPRRPSRRERRRAVGPRGGGGVEKSVRSERGSIPDGDRSGGKNGGVESDGGFMRKSGLGSVAGSRVVHSDRGRWCTTVLAQWSKSCAGGTRREGNVFRSSRTGRSIRITVRLPTTGPLHRARARFEVDRMLVHIVVRLLARFPFIISIPTARISLLQRLGLDQRRHSTAESIIVS